MKILLWCLPFLICLSCGEPKVEEDYPFSIQKVRDQKNKEFKSGKNSPLLEGDKEVFDSLNYFPIDEKYKIEAKLVKTSFDESFVMPSTGDESDKYVRYGIAKFELNGQPVQLNVYQNLSLQMQDGKVHLFVPFTDATTGKTTYGGGRYLDPKEPEGNTILLDFNRSYNPYCVYNSKYSCPIPPKDNWLNISIEAGEKDFKSQDKTL